MAAGREVLAKLKTAELKASRIDSNGGETAIAAAYWNPKTMHDDPDFTNQRIVIAAAQVIAVFPSATEQTLREGGIVPANRQLDHDAIRSRASALLAKQPELKIGPAAASIIAELGANPKTGKDWDYRHIERLIAPIWRGGQS